MYEPAGSTLLLSYSLLCPRSGGLELLFDNKKRFADVDIVKAPLADETGADATTTAVTMREALQWIKQHLLRQRPELFMAGASV